MMSRISKHFGNNWGWYLFGGTVGGFGTYLTQSYVSSTRRRTLREAIEDRMPANGDEMLDIRSANEVRVDDLRKLHASLRRRRKAVDVDSIVSGIKPSADPLTHHYVAERVLRAASEALDHDLSHAAAALMFMCVDSVDERLDGMYDVCAAPEGGVPATTVAALLKVLLATGQVPVEKRVREVPQAFYRTNDWREVAVDELMPPAPAEGGGMPKEEFKKLLCGDEVCIWGECYRIAEAEARRKAQELAAERARKPPWWAFWRQAASAGDDGDASASA